MKTKQELEKAIRNMVQQQERIKQLAKRLEQLREENEKEKRESSK